MTIFYLVRHGEPQWSLNETLKLKGAQRDFVPLTSLGADQASRAAKEIYAEGAELVVSSPYTRALQTASIISRELSLPLMVEHGLHEWIPDLSFQYDSLEQLSQLMKDYILNKGCYPKGESRPWESEESIKLRMEASLRKYTDYSKVIIVSHEMAIKGLTGIAESICHCQIINYQFQR